MYVPLCMCVGMYVCRLKPLKKSSELVSGFVTSIIRMYKYIRTAVRADYTLNEDDVKQNSYDFNKFQRYRLMPDGRHC